MLIPTARDIGQLLIGSFPGTTVPKDLRSLAGEFNLGGVILFSRNVEAPEQVAELAGDAESLGRGMPAWVSIDQEGGRVARLKEPFTRWPPMAVLGRAKSEGLAERFGRALARELRAVGITLDYAPDGTTLTVTDHGETAPTPNGSGYGLTGMRERAELLGGRLDARPTSDGFRVELWLPT